MDARDGKQVDEPPMVPPDSLEAPQHAIQSSSTDTLDEALNDGSDADHPTYVEQRMSQEIHQLARKASAQSSSSHAPLFPVAEGCSLDPNSPHFSAKRWAKAYYHSRVITSNGKGLRYAGIAFKNLSAYGFGTDTDFQKTVGNYPLSFARSLIDSLRNVQQRVDILHNVEGLVKKGEMLCVLGPPGSGCSTLLRTIAGDTHGFHVGQDATLNYAGITSEQMRTAYRGEAIYTAEVDNHFPHLTVGDTLYVAAAARTPQSVPDGTTRREYAEHLRDVIMAMFGILHTKNTRVGDDFVRGVSGGERKRVTIAEAALGFSPLQCWDNSTRGLDSVNAIEFCRTLRTQADVMGCASCVAIYQAPQAAYEVFDKVVLLYEGRQIFFGHTKEAKAYFEGLGFLCPEQRTTPDFLTSMTSHSERITRPGWEGRVPRTPDEFAAAWKASEYRTKLIEEIDSYIEQHPFDGEHHEEFLESRRADQSKMQRAGSPFTLSYFRQIKLTLWRNWVLLKNDPSMTLTLLVVNLFEALIISSVFYNLSSDSSSLFRRTILLFFVVILNAFASMLEIMTLYAKRKVVEKHARYAFFHPSAEAIAAIIADLPYKILNAIFVNVTIYFMANLRREPGAFFFFLLYNFTLTLTMSGAFRLIGSVTKSIAQALAPASIIFLALILYCGFTIPPPYMEVWLGWLRWVNPVYYSTESVFLNEFVGRQFQCTDFVPSGPGYDAVGASERVCTVAGSVLGQDFVDGTTYLNASFGFVNSHRWRNLGILIAFMVVITALHLLTTELISSERSKGEVLIFTRKALKRHHRTPATDTEKGPGNSAPQKFIQSESDSEGVVEVDRQTAVFHWRDVCYDIKIKGEDRRILDHVDGWVKPGTLTALMGVSGAGKTTLLDVLADRVTMGVVQGRMLVDGQERDSSFQRKTGYVTQQDLHLHTSTVREALTFSALLRQPAHYTRQEKIAYVDTVISLLNMEEYSDAIIGTPGEGLNVEQRKRLTIGVELAARPQLLIFFDEPTSGLDSQTSWSICSLLHKLADSGQAVLCTVHQPSALLFQRFDRLLLLAKGGKTVYFGDVGKNSAILMDYFVRNGGKPLPDGGNPAEHMLEVIEAAPGTQTDIDWHQVWRSSPEYEAVTQELVSLSAGKAGSIRPANANSNEYNEFATPFSTQAVEVTKRAFQRVWRSSSYVYSKFVLSVGTALFIGLSILNSDNSIRGLQNQMFGIFLFLMIFTQLIDQFMPVFCEQRMLYEARERPAKTYSWKAFMLASIVVETVWNSLFAVICFIVWYFPIGLYRNAEWTDQVHSRGVTTFLHVWQLFFFTTSFGHVMIAGLPNEEIAGGILNLLMIMLFAFCGVLAGPDQLPRFWIFMYRVNPFTYVIDSLLGTATANAPIVCADNEIVAFHAPDGNTCDEYLQDYLGQAPGQLVAGSANSSDCLYCPMKSTNDFLSTINSDFSNRWRNFGIMWAYIGVNLIGAVFFYWLARVPKNRRDGKL